MCTINVLFLFQMLSKMCALFVSIGLLVEELTRIIGSVHRFVHMIDTSASQIDQ